MTNSRFTGGAHGLSVRKGTARTGRSGRLVGSRTGSAGNRPRPQPPARARRLVEARHSAAQPEIESPTRAFETPVPLVTRGGACPGRSSDLAPFRRARHVRFL